MRVVWFGIYRLGITTFMASLGYTAVSRVLNCKSKQDEALGDPPDPDSKSFAGSRLRVSGVLGRCASFGSQLDGQHNTILKASKASRS